MTTREETPAATVAVGTDVAALAAGLVTVTAWGSAFVGIRAAGETLSPGALALGRLIVSLAILGTVAAVRRERLPARRDLLWIATFGVLWLAVYSVALNEAERRVDAGTAAMLVNTGPILIAIFAGIFLREGFPPGLFAGCAVAFCGVVVIAFATAQSGARSGLGVVLCIVAAFAYAVAVVVQKPVLARVSAFQVTWIGLAAATIACLPFAPALATEAARRRCRRRSPGSSISAPCRRRSASRPGRSRCGAPAQAGWARSPTWPRPSRSSSAGPCSARRRRGSRLPAARCASPGSPSPDHVPGCERLERAVGGFTPQASIITPAMPSRAEQRSPDALVVGAGFSGLYALHRLRELGLSVRLVERGGGVGGTWYWNRYPGARCDIESVDYQFSFSDELLEEWEWTERYAAQPEILRYLEFVADRFDLRRDIELETSVTAARYDEEADRWLVTTDAGRVRRAIPHPRGREPFVASSAPTSPASRASRASWYQTARWPQEPVDLDGKRVGVVGTGSTGIQVVTESARQARALWVFQRTPNYSMPAHNGAARPGDASARSSGALAERRRMRELSEAGVPFPAPEHRAYEVSDEERRRMYEEGWARGGINSLSYAFSDFHSDEAANATGAEFTRERIREIVRDPAWRPLLPSHHIGTRRTCVDTGYYEAFNQANVHLVDVAALADRDDHAARDPDGRRRVRARRDRLRDSASTR